MHNSWSISNIWNELLTDEYPIQPRSYIRASEIGKSYLDRFLAMQGIPPTNPFTPRIKRVFDCGHIFETEVMERIFRLLGLLEDTQKTVVIRRKGMLEVMGHYDFRVGGKIDSHKARKEILGYDVSPWLRERALKLLDLLIEKYPEGLESLIAEIKTVNSMAFWAHKNTDPATQMFRGYDHHKLQLFTYLEGEDEERGRLFYISKDDLTLMETGVFHSDSKLRQLWEQDVTTMTDYYLRGIEPPREPDVILNEEKGTYEPNFKVGRSNYLTLLTGFKTVEEWEASLAEKLSNLNQKPCKICGKLFQITTLAKNEGVCGRCAKKGGERQENEDTK